MSPDGLRRRSLRNGLAALVMAAFVAGSLHLADAPLADDLGHDADADFLRRIGADVQTDRRVHAVEVMAVDALRFQTLPHFGDLALAADHAEVAGVAVVNLLQNMLVVLVAARHEDHVIVVAKIERLADLGRIP